MTSRKITAGVVSIKFRTQAYTENCAGIVIKSKPLTIVIPQHAAQSIEDNVAETTSVNGIAFRAVSILADTHLSGSHLTVLRLSDPDKQVYLSPLRLFPRKISQAIPGSPLTILTPCTQKSEAQTLTGQAISISADLDSSSVETDIPIKPGQSGSPILRGGRLYGIVQGQRNRPESGSVAIGIPLSLGVLRRMHELGQIRWQRLLVRTLAILCIAVLPLALFMIMGGWHYPIEGLEVLEDRQTVVVSRNAIFPSRASWTYLTASRIFDIKPIASSVSGEDDLVAIGTTATPDVNGSLTVLDSSGKLLWTYSIPEGECPYEGGNVSYDWFSATHVYPSDLDLDGENELIVAFAHMTWRPAKIMVFELDGTILAEYWHPGYVRTIHSGPMGEGKQPISVISASNNSLQYSWWNPQVIFAFRGLDISGRGPEPGFGESESSHLWYWVITNLNPEEHRAKATVLAFVDYNADQVTEIRAQLTDGRFYYFDSSGDVVGTAAGDIYLRDYGQTPIPSLMTVEEFIDSKHQEIEDES